MDITKTRQICCLFHRMIYCIGLILGLCPANKRCYKLKLSLIGSNLESALLYLSGQVKLSTKCKQALDDKATICTPYVAHCEHWHWEAPRSMFLHNEHTRAGSIL